MPEDFTQKDFSNGWTPSVSPLNGSPASLLVMDNLDIDTHGEVKMVDGTKKILATDFGASVHSMYSKYINGGLTYYLATTDGKVYRNTADIAAAGGSTTRTAFASAFNRVFILSGDWRVRDTGATITNLGLAAPGSAVTFGAAVSGDLTGSYEYCQINVLKDGGYQAKSPRNTIATQVLSSQSAKVTPSATGESQTTEAWIFRRGGKLPRFYRVKVVAVADIAVEFTDNQSDSDTLLDGYVLNENAVAINSATITEAVVEVVGLIFGRFVYFTPTAVHFSEINSPDSIDPTQSISHSGDDSELFLWARQVGEGSILVATSKDLYLLTGTFITQPDGTLDIALRPLGVEAKPLSRDAAVYNGTVVYMSTYGWRAVDQTGISNSLVIPATDILYRGQNTGGSTPDYYGVPSVTHNVFRYAVAVAEERMWCRVPTLEVASPYATKHRFEVFDLAKKYWHNRHIPDVGGAEGIPEILHSTEEDFIVGVIKEGSSYYLYYLDHFEGKTLDQSGTPVKQTVGLKTIFFDMGNPRNRKDSTMLILGVNTGNDALTVAAFKDGDQSTSIALGTVTSNGWAIKLININSAVGKYNNLQIHLSGQVADFRLSFISTEFDPYPNQVFRYIVKAYGFGEFGPRKKRLRVWPIVVDTLGQNITATPNADGSNLTAQTLNANGKLTSLINVKTDAFGVDYGLVLSSTNPFEVWEIGQPDIVQILPVAKRFDQVGPLELARYGLIKTLEVRVIAFSGTTIPYTIYVDDTSEDTGNLTVVSGKEKVASITIPQRTTANEDGSVIRVELGPTAFDFHRIYARVLASKSGNTSNLKWIILDNELVG